MKRALLAFGWLPALFTLGMAVTLYTPTISATTIQHPKLPTYPGPYGLGGKISLRPPGNYEQSGPVAWRKLLGPLAPLALPVFGTDVNASAANSANEVVIASNPTNALNFVGGANSSGGSGRYTTTD